jgi:hypothetical protein
MSPKPAAVWTTPVVSRDIVTAPNRVLKVVRVVASSQQKDSVARALAAGREAQSQPK